MEEEINIQIGKNDVVLIFRNDETKVEHNTTQNKIEYDDPVFIAEAIRTRLLNDESFYKYVHSAGESYLMEQYDNLNPMFTSIDHDELSYFMLQPNEVALVFMRDEKSNIYGFANISEINASYHKLFIICGILHLTEMTEDFLTKTVEWFANQIQLTQENDKGEDDDTNN